MKKLLLFIILAVLLTGNASIAQTTDSLATESKFKVDVGMDVLNNFIWRGVPLDQGPCLQPAAIVSYQNLQLSFLGSYSFKYDFNNILTKLAYNIKTDIGTISPTVIDYYYPYDPVGLTRFRTKYSEEAQSFTHTVETAVEYVGDKVPLRLYGSVNVHNDPDHSTYFEAGYTFTVSGVSVEPFAGAVLNASPAWHAAEKPGLLNLGFNAFKKIKVSDSYSLPLTGTMSYHSQLDMLNIMVRLSIF